MGDNRYSCEGFRRYSYWIYCPKSHWLVYLFQHAQVVGSAYPLYQPVRIVYTGWLVL
jgi:putative effector of murein hydrolase